MGAAKETSKKTAKKVKDSGVRYAILEAVKVELSEGLYPGTDRELYKTIEEAFENFREREPVGGDQPEPEDFAIYKIVPIGRFHNGKITMELYTDK